MDSRDNYKLGMLPHQTVKDLMTITINPQDGSPVFVLDYPAEAREAMNEYAKSVDKTNAQSLLVAFIQDSLMEQIVIPRTPVPSDLQVEIDLIKAEADAAVAQLNEKRVEPYKPTLTVDGTPTPLAGQGK